LILPIVTTTRRPGDAYLRLSDQFLVNKHSNIELICDFLENQWTYSGFDIEDNKSPYLF
jgi:hypothetical protein